MSVFEGSFKKDGQTIYLSVSLLTNRGVVKTPRTK